jgi:hypothetical protein
MQLDSHFGAWEAAHHMRRGWTVMAKEKTVVFSIHMLDFSNIFKKTPYYKPFLEAEAERYPEMESANRECGRNIRRMKRAKSKINRIKKDTVNHLLTSIHLSKNKRSKSKRSKWYGTLRLLHNRILKPNITKERDKMVEKAVGKLKLFH